MNVKVFGWPIPKACRTLAGIASGKGVVPSSQDSSPLMNPGTDTKKPEILDLGLSWNSRWARLIDFDRNPEEHLAAFVDLDVRAELHALIVLAKARLVLSQDGLYASRIDRAPIDQIF